METIKKHKHTNNILILLVEFLVIFSASFISISALRALVLTSNMLSSIDPKMKIYYFNI